MGKQLIVNSRPVARSTHLESSGQAGELAIRGPVVRGARGINCAAHRGPVSSGRESAFMRQPHGAFLHPPRGTAKMRAWCTVPRTPSRSGYGRRSRSADLSSSAGWSHWSGVTQSTSAGGGFRSAGRWRCSSSGGTPGRCGCSPGTRPGCCRGRRRGQSSRRDRSASPATRCTSACWRSTSGWRLLAPTLWGLVLFPAAVLLVLLGRDPSRGAVSARPVRSAVRRLHAAGASLAVTARVAYSVGTPAALHPHNRKSRSL